MRYVLVFDFELYTINKLIYVNKYFKYFRLPVVKGRLKLLQILKYSKRTTLCQNYKIKKKRQPACYIKHLIPTSNKFSSMQCACTHSKFNNAEFACIRMCIQIKLDKLFSLCSPNAYAYLTFCGGSGIKL